MNTIKSLLLLFATIVVIVSCSSDDTQVNSYPKLFLFDRYEIGDYAEYLVGENESYTEINPTTREDTLVANTLHWLSELPNVFQEFELLDESMIRLKIGQDTQILDTVFTYQIIGSFLIIDGIFEGVGDKFLEYNSNDEQLYVRNRADISLPGPNAVNPNAFYYDFVDITNTDFETLDEHLNYLLNEYEYAVGDTIIVYEPRRVYQ